MTPDELIEHFTTQVKAAEALRTQQSNVADWKRLGRVPYRWQMLAERITDGAIKADVDGWKQELPNSARAAD
jgi:hypothetical protein